MLPPAKPPRKAFFRRVPRAALLFCCATSALAIVILSMLSAAAIQSLLGASVTGAAFVSVVERAGEFAVTASGLTWRWETNAPTLAVLLAGARILLAHTPALRPVASPVPPRARFRCSSAASPSHWACWSPCAAAATAASPSTLARRRRCPCLARGCRRPPWAPRRRCPCRCRRPPPS